MACHVNTRLMRTPIFARPLCRAELEALRAAATRAKTAMVNRRRRNAPGLLRQSMLLAQHPAELLRSEGFREVMVEARGQRLSLIFLLSPTGDCNQGHSAT